MLPLEEDPAAAAHHSCCCCCCCRFGTALGDGFEGFERLGHRSSDSEDKDLSKDVAECGEFVVVGDGFIVEVIIGDATDDVSDDDDVGGEACGSSRRNRTLNPSTLHWTT